MKSLWSFWPKRRWQRRLMIGVILLPVLWLLSSLIVAYALTRRPHAWFAEPAPTVTWGKLEEHQLTTSDGETLGAWFLRGPADGPAVLVLHGNGGCRRNSLAAAEFYARHGCSVLMVSLRAHGDSSGAVNDIGYSARHDVVAAVAFLERERPGRRIIVHGSSLGAAAAVFAAADLGERVHGYILEGPYRDLYRAVRNRMAANLPPGLDRIAYAGVVFVGPLVLPEVDRISPLAHITDIPPTVPVLFLSGTRDNRAFSSEAQEMCDRIADHGRLVLFDGAGHESLLHYDPRQFDEAVSKLLHEVNNRR